MHGNRFVPCSLVKAPLPITTNQKRIKAHARVRCVEIPIVGVRSLALANVEQKSYSYPTSLDHRSERNASAIASARALWRASTEPVSVTPAQAASAISSSAAFG